MIQPESYRLALKWVLKYGGILLGIAIVLHLLGLTPDEDARLNKVLEEHGLPKVEVKEDLSFDYNFDESDKIREGIAYEFDIVTFDMGDTRNYSGATIHSRGRTYQDYHIVYDGLGGQSETIVTNPKIRYFDVGSDETSKYVIDGDGGIHLFLQRGIFNQY